MWDTTQTDSDQKSTFPCAAWPLARTKGKAMSKSKEQPSNGGVSGPTIAKSKRASQQKPVEQAIFQPNAAGIDIGAREIYASVVTPKPANGGHFKTGQRSRCQDELIFTPSGRSSASLFLVGQANSRTKNPHPRCRGG